MSKMMKSDFFKLPDEQRAKAVLAALKKINNLAELFGKIADEKTAKKRYQAISKKIHPDMLDGDDVAAKEAFQELNDLWQQAQEQINNGVYGTALVPSANSTKTGSLSLDGRTYRFGRLLGEGDISDVYLGLDEAGEPVVVKCARNVGDNDLMDNELQILDDLAISDGYDHMSKYYPRLVASGKDSNRCRINVLQYDAQFIETPEKLASLKDIVKAFDGKLNVRHVGWIWRKLITGLAFAHRSGIIHAAITPDNILVTIDNELHGIVLGGWIYGSQNQSSVVGMSADWEDLYPPNVGANESVQPTPALDVYMAAKSMMWAFPDMPDDLLRYFDWCAQDSQNLRPTNFDDLDRYFKETIFNRLNWPSEFVRLNYIASNTVDIDWNWF